MKCSTGIVFVIVLLISVFSKPHKKSTNSHGKLAKKYANLAKMLNCASKPLKKTCKKCLHSKGNKLFFFYQATRLRKFVYKFMIHYNDKTKTILITFSGPTRNYRNYLKYIYSSGWKSIRQNSVSIEKEFFNVYFQKIRSILVKKVKKVMKSGRKNYKFHFTGFGLGGSIATLAAFDLTSRNVINSKKNMPLLLTFGQLRIGNLAFVKRVNATIQLIFRIVKENDYIVRAPSCYFSHITKTWKCFNKKAVSVSLKKNKFPLKNYLRGYLGKNKSKSASFVKNILRNQPLGKLVLYNPKMKKFKLCAFKNGVSDCEKKIKTPNTFSEKSHFSYFGLKFNKC